MAWIAIPTINWEYSSTPEVDDPYNTTNYTGRHTSGIRTNSDGTQIYVFCRMTGRTNGIGYGEIKVIGSIPITDVYQFQDGTPFVFQDGSSFQFN